MKIHEYQGKEVLAQVPVVHGVQVLDILFNTLQYLSVVQLYREVSDTSSCQHGQEGPKAGALTSRTFVFELVNKNAHFSANRQIEI